VICWMESAVYRLGWEATVYLFQGERAVFKGQEK